MADLTPIPLSQAQPLSQTSVRGQGAQSSVVGPSPLLPPDKTHDKTITLRDYQHAAKIFLSDNNRLLPKQSFLFHVFIELNDDAVSSKLVPSSANRELSFLVKSVDLPKFTIDTKTLNAYNRPNIIQTKVKYDPVTIVFHDDSADVVRKFWYDYYSYYYRDAHHADAIYGNKLSTSDWGYNPLNSVPYIKSIKIYSLHQRRFSEYVLFNPIITSWSHGKHNNDAKESLDHTMVLSYESIQYKDGPVSDVNVLGFGDPALYDNTISPNTEKIKNALSAADLQAATLADQRRGQSVLMESFNVNSIASASIAGTPNPLITGQNSQYRIVVPGATTFSESIKATPSIIPTSTRQIT
jgi:hypothetical protein